MKKCEERVFLPGDNLMSHPHGVAAMYEHQGRWYCKAHHPPTVKAKADERRSKWKAGLDAKDAARAEAAAIREAEQRVLAIAAAMQSENERGCDVLESLSLNVLYDAVRDLKALGWEPES